MKIKIYNQWSNRPKYKGRQPIGESMTVPDQSMDIREILLRFQSGLPPLGMKVPLYNENDDTPDVRRLDLAEIEELRDQAREEYKARRKRFIEQEKAKREKAQQGPKVQRTTGDAGDQDTADQPDNPISVKTGGGGAQPPDTSKRKAGK